MNVTLQEVLNTIPKDFYSGKINIRIFDGQSESLVDIDTVVLRNDHRGKVITLVAAGSSVASKEDAVKQDELIVASPNAEKEQEVEAGAAEVDQVPVEPVRIKRVYRKRSERGTV
jgi:hypothetical protein